MSRMDDVEKGILVVNAFGDIQVANRKLHDMFGYKKGTTGVGQSMRPVHVGRPAAAGFALPSLPLDVMQQSTQAAPLERPRHHHRPASMLALTLATQATWTART